MPDVCPYTPPYLVKPSNAANQPPRTQLSYGQVLGDIRADSRSAALACSAATQLQRDAERIRAAPASTTHENRIATPPCHPTSKGRGARQPAGHATLVTGAGALPRKTQQAQLLSFVRLNVRVKRGHNPSRVHALPAAERPASPARCCLCKT